MLSAVISREIETGIESFLRTTSPQPTRVGLAQENFWHTLFGKCNPETYYHPVWRMLDERGRSA